MNPRQMHDGVRIGDTESLKALYNALRLAKGVGKYLRGQCPQDWEDLTSNVFVEMQKRIRGGEIEHPQWMLTYAGTVARNLVAARKKEQARTISIDAPLAMAA